MPSITCEINIINKFKDTQFFLFQEIPKVENGPSSDIFSNVFKVTDGIEARSDGSSSIRLELDNNFFAIFGSKSGSGTSTRISNVSYKSITLGPEGSVVCLTSKNKTFKFDDIAAAGRSAENQGGFQFITDDTIPTDNDSRYIGVGVADPDNEGQVLPIATYLAEPSLNSMLYPKMTYYVATGSYEPGKLVDRNAIGKYVKIDFEGSKIHKAKVVLEANGNWIDPDNVSLKNGVKITPQKKQ